MSGFGVLISRVSQPRYQSYSSGFHIYSEPERATGLSVLIFHDVFHVIYRGVSSHVLFG